MDFFPVVAGNKAAWFHFNKFRNFLRTFFGGVAASFTELAAGRWVNWAWNFAFQFNACFFSFGVRVSRRNSGN